MNQQLLRMSKELEIGLVCTNDVHYTYESDAEAHDVLLCIQTGKKVSDEDRMRYDGGQFFVKSEEQMRALFPYATEAIENTQKIADRCNVTLEFGNYKIPKYVYSPSSKNLARISPLVLFEAMVRPPAYLCEFQN